MCSDRVRTAFSSVLLVSVTACGTLTCAAEPVPADRIERLKRYYTKFDGREAASRDATRKHRLVLQIGQSIEREFSEAENLYVVQAMMLNAAASLAHFSREKQYFDLMPELAKKILESEAPLRDKLASHLLLTRIALAATGLSSAEKQQILQDMLRPYRGTDIEPLSLIQGLQLAQVAQLSSAADTIGRTLNERFSEHPDVARFLVNRGDRHPLRGKPVRAVLTGLDGSQVVLPRDALGEIIVLSFWSHQTVGMFPPDVVWAATHGHIDSGGFRNIRGVRFITINLDDASERDKVVKALEAQHPVIQSFSHTFEGLGFDHPLAKRLVVRGVPTFYVILRDGTLHGGGNPGRRGGDVFGSMMLSADANAAAIVHTHRYYRSGLYLLSPSWRKHLGGMGEPFDERTNSEIMLAGFNNKLIESRIRSLHEQARDAAAEPSGGSLWPQVEMITAKWLSYSQRDSDAADEAFAKAEELLRDKDASKASRVVADYLNTQCAVSGAIGGPRAGDPDGPKLIRQFVTKYEGTAVAAPAQMFGVLLGMEIGDMMLCNEATNALETRYSDVPYVRGFLWSICRRRSGNKPFKLTVTDPNGEPMELPSAYANRPLVVHLWSTRYGDHLTGYGAKMGKWWPMPPAESSEYPRHYEEQYKTYCWKSGIRQPPNAKKEALFVSVNVDGDREAAASLREQYPKDWIHATVTRSQLQGFVERHGLDSVPSTWLVGDDGELIEGGASVGRVGICIRPCGYFSERIENKQYRYGVAA